MTCPTCNAQLPDNAGFCNNCGTRIAATAPPPYSPSPNQNAQAFEQTYNKAATAVKNYAWGDYFSFRRMITPEVIKVLYIIGAVFITFGGIVALFKGGDDFGYSRSFFPGGFFGGLIILIFGNLAWRLWCEFIIVMFRINSSLNNIDDNTRNRR